MLPKREIIGSIATMRVMEELKSYLYNEILR
jgi:hypothetical protein